MNVSDRFSLVDFLAYLFPGVLDILGLYLLFLLTPLSETLQKLIPLDLATGVLLLVMSYVIGVVFSGFSNRIVARIAQRRASRQRGATKLIKDRIPVPGFEQEIVAAFNTTFGSRLEDETDWKSACFYLSRSTVLQWMPGVRQVLEREGSLRQLRMNLLPTLAVWAAAGVLWGSKIIVDRMRVWGCVLIAGSLLVWFLTSWNVYNRMNRNEEREVREVLTGFLAGCKNGLFVWKDQPESGQ